MSTKAHNNVAAIGTTAANNYFNVNWQQFYKKNDVHAQVSTLKSNLREYRSSFGAGEPYVWNGVPSLAKNNSNTFDSDTEANVKKFQELVGITNDGIYGQESRNYMMAQIGVSPKGFVRVKREMNHYLNHNDIPSGLAADSTYKLDFSWVTPNTLTTLEELAQSYYQQFSEKLQINNCALIDGIKTPMHDSHQTGKEIDIRNASMTPNKTAKEKAFLTICGNNSNVSKIWFHTTHGLNISKIHIDSNHDDHFHIVTKN